MRTSAVQIAFFAFALVVAAALQELSPAVGGAKAALLGAVAFRAALTRSLVPALVCALAAGGLHDALSSLPGFCMSGFLMAVCAAAALVRGTDRPERRQARRNGGRGGAGAVLAACIFAAVAPLGELWTRLWLWRMDPSIFAGLLFSAVAGFLAELAVFPAMDAMERACGIPCDFREGGAS